MSHVKWVPLPEPLRRSPWRLFPWAVAAGMLVVIAVNGGMVCAALWSFPGQAGDEGFELNNHYDAVLAQAERQAALGWTIAARADEASRMVVVTLSDRGGAPLLGAVITATAERPLGAARTRRLGFRELGGGRYVADTALPVPGQWDVMVAASAQGHDVAATRRIVVR